ncbi:MAG TPA: DUF805 domain-containing protein [Chromatiaceae bacterium]|jgi:uncharacterized membrane protein YhaH (DUF805 family)|nr:MAG: hypothetical protein N838_04655 [Thiohalocapsa sp. PB-PSB1]QQO55162.1 MAG: DUF805 domain-containing protein [Thiohalocapsa sp. PB-PSB1]HBG94131.1 DUF805 domain-containing protein [Chromatiaceae bacterium]HCS91760.1 DUF805 domain-containing protein [Chromatiaceae bacterium]
MATLNPYQPPRADLNVPPDAGVDQTSPFDPKGRFGRLSYFAWLTAANFFAAIAQLMIGLLVGFSVGFTGSLDMQTVGSVIGMFLNFIISLIVLVVSILFFIRRLHDIDLSGWWVLFAPVVGSVAALLFVGSVAGGSSGLPIAVIILGLIAMGFSIYVLFKRGDTGTNQYGPPRETRGWERVVGIIAILLMVLSPLVVVIVAILFMGQMSNFM